MFTPCTRTARWFHLPTLFIPNFNPVWNEYCQLLSGWQLRQLQSLPWFPWISSDVARLHFMFKFCSFWHFFPLSSSRSPRRSGNEYRHSQHRYGVRSQYGKWVIITSFFFFFTIAGQMINALYVPVRGNTLHHHWGSPFRCSSAFFPFFFDRTHTDLWIQRKSSFLFKAWLNWPLKGLWCYSRVIKGFVLGVTISLLG